MAWLTQAKAKQLARQAVKKAGLKASPKTLGDARKVIVEMVDANPNRYIDMHGGLKKYYTILSDTITTEAAKAINPQPELF